MLCWLSQKYKLTVSRISGKSLVNCWMQSCEIPWRAPSSLPGLRVLLLFCRLPAERAKGAQTKTICQLPPYTLYTDSTRRRK